MEDEQQLYYYSAHQPGQGYTCLYSNSDKQCGKRFGHRSLILRHIRHHLGIKPFICEFCPYAASQKSTVEAHIAQQHKEIAQELLNEYTAKMDDKYVCMIGQCKMNFNLRPSDRANKNAHLNMIKHVKMHLKDYNNMYN